MPLQLTWKDRNLFSDGTRIYRSEQPMSPAALPAPLVTLAPGVMSYIDNDVVQNKLYYYILETFKGNDKLQSSEHVLGSFPYTGPGRNQPLRGDFRDGYFGTLTMSEMFTDTELHALLSPGGTRPNTATKWFKFALDGKILFTPNSSMSTSVTWDNLNQKNLVFGFNGPNPPAQVEKNGHRFAVRLFTGTNNPTETMSSSGRPTDKSEWDRLIYRIVQGQVATEGPKWDDYAHSGTDSANGSAAFLMQDLGSVASSRVSRGGNGVNGITSAPATNPGHWRPVLELIF